MVILDDPARDESCISGFDGCIYVGSEVTLVHFYNS
jgi:hypothetical protein